MNLSNDFKDCIHTIYELSQKKREEFKQKLYALLRQFPHKIGVQGQEIFSFPAGDSLHFWEKTGDVIIYSIPTGRVVRRYAILWDDGTYGDRLYTTRAEAEEALK